MNENPIARVLMVEDEEEVLRINARIMRRRGYEVLTACSCAEAYAILEAETPELLILDIMLPDGSGLELCRRFRADFEQPVIFLTGKSGTADRIEGLNEGADYYLTKPYEPDELLAVAARLIQRHRDSSRRRSELSRIEKGSLVLDISAGRATVGGADAGLTAKEFALLLTLVRCEGRELSAHALYETVWGAPGLDDIRTVRTHIKNLRRKTGADNAEDFDIVSSYGKGYTFTTLR